jgi:acyl-coenzyme A thioesterase PaaI-like protein
MMPLRHQEWFGCFGCAPRNPRGLLLVPRRTAPGEASCDVTFHEDFCSHPGVVHGGIVSTAVDDLMANLLVIERRALTLSTVLRVRYLTPVLTARPYRIVARIVGEWPDGFRTEADVHSADGTLCATATATYVVLGPERLRAFVAAEPAARAGLAEFLTDREENGDEQPATRRDGDQ